MGRSRILKPGFFVNPDLVELDPWIRLLFAGLWTIADREGRLEDRPKKIKMELFPADGFDINAGLSQLAQKGFIERYAIEANCYIQINSWGRHQKIHSNEVSSIIPKPQIKTTFALLDQKTSTSTSTSTKAKPSSMDTSCLENSNSDENQKPLDSVWGDGVQLLISTGIPEGQARSFLGGLVKTYGKEAVQSALEQAKQQNAIEPKSYLIKVLQSRQLKGPIPSVADEERHLWEENRKIWLRMPYAIPVDRDSLDEITVIGTNEYEPDTNSNGLPWQVRRTDNPDETLDIRVWEPINNQQAEEIRLQQEVHHVA